MPQNRNYDYHPVNNGYKPQTIGAFVLMIGMFVILFVLYFIIGPKLSHIPITSSKTNCSNETSTQQYQPDIKLAFIVESPPEYVEIVRKCEDLIPGIEQLLHGIDITNPLSAKEFQQIFKFTCDLDHFWIDRNSKHNFTLPDQIEKIHYSPGEIRNFENKFYQNIFNYKASFASNFAFNVSDADFVGSFATSELYRDGMKQLLELDQSIFETNSYTSLLRINLKNETKLSKNFVDFLTEKLFHVHYDKNPQVYEDFINIFGTHYLDSALLGGILNQRTFIDNKFLYKSDFREIEIKIKDLFREFVSLDRHDIFLDEHFKNYTKIYYNFYGGLKDSNLSTWINSIAENPQLLSGTLKPIENLIQDETTKKELRKAIKIRQLKAHLREIRDFLYFSGIILPEKENLLIEKIQKYLNDPKVIPSDLVLIQYEMNRIFKNLQETKDRSTLESYHAKLLNVSNDIILCKFSLTTACHSKQLNPEFERQDQKDYQLHKTFLKLINQRPAHFDGKQMFNLLQQTTKHIEYHQTNGVNICENYRSVEKAKRCLTCVESNVNCWYSKNWTCMSEHSWEVVGHWPVRVNFDCKTIILNSGKVDPP